MVLSQLPVLKKSAYTEYRDIKKDMKELVAAKHNIDHLLGLTDGHTNKEQER